VVVATQAELAQIQWLYRADTSKIVIIPPGVDTAHFYAIPADEAKEVIGHPDEACMLLYVGRIEPLKGIDSLLEAMAVMKAKGFLQEHPICLAIIGGEPDASEARMSAEMERLKELCASLELSDLVLFLGRQDQDTLPYYYSAAEVVIVPSHYESFGMVALEAMACGTPVVASETGGLAFLVRDGETGFHVPAADPGALADRLIQLMSEEELRRRLGKQAAAYAGAYDWSIIADQIVELYELALAESRREPA
jgi:D-inositol-3-phosphate glycosyltransferase